MEGASAAAAAAHAVRDLRGCEEQFPLALGVAASAVAGILLVAVAFYVCNGVFGCMPLIFTRIINDRSFLLEYERRLDRVVQHDIRKKYRVGRRLGEGMTSAVYRVQEIRTGTYFALKKIPLKNSKSLERAVEREIKILRKLRHHHITTLHDVFSSPNCVWAILEYVSGGELTNYIMLDGAEWDESHAIRCFFQVVSALAYLHSQGVVHRDIKMANLLRSVKGPNFQMKVADFGAACTMEVPSDVASAALDADDESLVAFKRIAVGRECVGTPCNMAPEVFDRRYGPMCDMWSLGCVLYELLLGEAPFDPYKLPPDDPEFHLKKNVRAGRYPKEGLAGWAELSGEAREVVDRLLTVDPSARISAFEALRHPLMKARYRAYDSASDLSACKKNMKRRKTETAPPAKGLNEPAAPAGEAAAGDQRRRTLMTAPQREPSVVYGERVAMSEGTTDSNGAADSDGELDPAVIEARKTAITGMGKDGWDEEPSARHTSSTHIKVEVRSEP